MEEKKKKIRKIQRIWRKMRGQIGRADTIAITCLELGSLRKYLMAHGREIGVRLKGYGRIDGCVLGIGIKDETQGKSATVPLNVKGASVERSFIGRGKMGRHLMEYNRTLVEVILALGYLIALLTL
jgi:hypothetical protein